MGIILSGFMRITDYIRLSNRDFTIDLGIILSGFMRITDYIRLSNRDFTIFGDYTIDLGIILSGFMRNTDYQIGIILSLGIILLIWGLYYLVS